MRFDGRQIGGHPFGWRGNYKVIPTHHSYSVHYGEVWAVEEILRWEADTMRCFDKVKQPDYPVQWGAVIYVWPVKRLS